MNNGTACFVSGMLWGLLISIFGRVWTWKAPKGAEVPEPEALPGIEEQRRRELTNFIHYSGDEMPNPKRVKGRNDNEQ